MANVEGKGFSRRNAQASTYICGACDKRTRETGWGESDLDLCLKCYCEAGLENEHFDNLNSGLPNDHSIATEMPNDGPNGQIKCPACVEATEPCNV
jgi:hypothetical protein